MDQPVSLAMAFVAGLISFLSPCVLPLVPAYAAQLAGSGATKGSRLPANALAFIGGFTALFVLLGLSASAIGQVLAVNQDTIRRVGAVLVVVFGLEMAGILKLRVLERTWQPVAGSGASSPLAAFFTGVAFSAGWTPCVGPVLSSVLVLAGTSGTALTGGILLAVYSAGLGLPFLAVAVLARRLLPLLPRLYPLLPGVQRAGGILMVASGILLYFDGLARLARLFPGGIGG